MWPCGSSPEIFVRGWGWPGNVSAAVANEQQHSLWCAWGKADSCAHEVTQAHVTPRQSLVLRRTRPFEDRLRNSPTIKAWRRRPNLRLSWGRGIFSNCLPPNGQGTFLVCYFYLIFPNQMQRILSLLEAHVLNVPGAPPFLLHRRFQTLEEQQHALQLYNAAHATLLHHQCSSQALRRSDAVFGDNFKSGCSTCSSGYLKRLRLVVTGLLDLPVLSC